jgi:hypothetical protein
MKVHKDRHSGTTLISEASGVVSVEALTLNECAILQHKMWLIAHTAMDEGDVTFFRRMEGVFAALTNDTSAIILTTTDDLEP